MSNDDRTPDDRALAVHEATLRHITAWKGKLWAGQAEAFALAQGGLLLYKYDITAGIVYLSDGEPYSWVRILNANAADLFGGREEQCPIPIPQKNV